MEVSCLHPVDYLVVAAHPDDAEISVGGIISGLVTSGATVGILDLTDGEPTPYGSPEIRARETEEASRELGITWRANLGLPNRKLENSLAAREALANCFRRARPRVLLTHHPKDTHPDHVAASALVDGARFWAKLTKSTMRENPWFPPVLLHFFSIHLREMPRARVVVDVSANFETKLRALRCYQSQLVEGRIPAPFMPLEELETIGKAWGRTIRAKYGEPLDSPEEIGLSSLIGIC